MTFKARESYRFRVRIPATLFILSGEKLDVVVTDLARLGFKCETPQMVAIGSNATLVIRDVGSFETTVRWNVGRSLGGLCLKGIQAELVSRALTSSVNLAPFENNQRPLADLVRC